MSSTIPESQIQRLIDRDEITAVIVRFGKSIDTGDQTLYASLFTIDGVLELPFGTFTGREDILGMPTRGPEWATQHLMAIPDIEIDGHTARAYAHAQQTHIFDRSNPAGNASSGGIYHVSLARTADEGWRIAHLSLEILWTGSAPMIPGSD